MWFRKLKTNSALIVEMGGHYFLLDEVISVFEEGHNVEALVLVENVNKFEEEFANHRGIKTHIYVTEGGSLVAKIRRVLTAGQMCVYLVFHGYNCSRIYFATGPERVRSPIVFFWSIATYILRKRVILNVRNVGAYWPTTTSDSKRRCAGLMRKFVAKRINLFTFENEAMRETVHSCSGRDDLSSVVIPVRCADSQIREHIQGVDTDLNTRTAIRIGLLGTINEDRKDYGLVADALRYMPHDLANQVRIEFITQDASGTLPMALSEGLVSSISLRNEVIPESAMWQLAAKCTALISPLNYTLAYGALKGTGTVGDAIAMRKLLIIPLWADPLKEFAAFCQYYSNSVELAKILTEIVINPDDAKLSDDTFEQYSRTSIQVKFSLLF